jgi:hypothetical protein
VFQIFPLVFPRETPAGFKSYIVPIILHLFHSDHVTTAIWIVSFDPIFLCILRRTMAYVSSVHNNLDWFFFLKSPYFWSYNVHIHEAKTYASN